MTTLYAISGLIAVLLGTALWIWYKGRASRAGADAIASNKVKDEQLEALTSAPKTPRELAEKLRKGGGF